MSDIRQRLQHILRTGDYSLLEPLKSRRLWKSWPPEERELLAKALVRMGTLKISQQKGCADQESVECFALAEQISPANGGIFAEQGAVYLNRFAKSQVGADLSFAINRYRKALACSPHQPQAILDLAKALMLNADYPSLETATDEVSALLRSIDATSIATDALRGRLFQLRGEHLLALGCASGEALELHQAVAEFRKTRNLDSETPPRWQPYCRALEQLAMLTGRYELYAEAQEWLERHLMDASGDPELWFQVGRISAQVYEFSKADTDYQRADHAFTEAASLAPLAWQHWWRWGALRVAVGKARQQLPLVREGLHKLGRANKLQPNSVSIVSQIAECQYLLGLEVEDLKSLHQARRCLQRCIEKEPFDIAHYIRMGHCQMALGRYFADPDHVSKGLAVLQEAFGLFGSTLELRIGLALCSAALADMTVDPQVLEEALEHFEAGTSFAKGRVDVLIEWASSLLKIAEARGGDRDKVALAVEKLQQALQLCDHMGIAPNAHLLFHFGCALDFVGDLTGEELHYEKAIQLLSQVVQMDPEHYSARFNLAIVYSHHGEAFENPKSLQIAARQLALLAQLQPEDELVWQEWGVCLTHLARLRDLEERNPEALQHLSDAEGKLRQALRLGALTALYHLSGLHALRGQKEGAFHFLQRAIDEKAVPGLEELQEDEWLDSLRDDARFLQLVRSLEEMIAREGSVEPQSGAEDASNNN